MSNWVAIIRDGFGDEIRRYELDEDATADCDAWADQWAAENNVSIMRCGHVPDGVEDISVVITDDSDSPRNWDSRNYMIEA